jgi:hypothetical protein
MKSSAHFGYFDKSGNKITRMEWNNLKEDPSYVTVREYDNGVVYVRIQWTGAQANPSNTFRDCFALFVANVANYNSRGEPMSDPVEDGTTFSTEKDAIEFYEKFLSRWTDSEKADNGEFIEADNSLTPPVPPPPPSKDLPSSDVSNVKGPLIDECGAW